MHYEDLISDAPGARRELVWFVLVLGALTALNVGALFYRQQPLIEHRQYDFASPFEFKQILHNGDMRFKACFHKNVQGGFYLCFLFPPPKRLALHEGFFDTDAFERVFIDSEYMRKYINKFKEKKWDTGHHIAGFQIQRLKDSYKVTPTFAK
ncbi:MAG: hypothetical protein RRB13_14560 [bacterium]|nr:hypothetical protein [bacterium]